MKTFIEKLKEKSFDASHSANCCSCVPIFDEAEQPAVYVSDAIEIMKELYTKEEVEYLLDQQRILCADKSLSLEKRANQKATMLYYIIYHAPQPELKK